MRHAGERCHPAPKQETEGHELPLRESIADLTGDGRAQSVYPQEHRSRESELSVGESQFGFQNREDRENHLSIAVIEAVGDPREADQEPRLSLERSIALRLAGKNAVQAILTIMKLSVVELKFSA